jgi:acyl-CoA hydrolase
MTAAQPWSLVKLDCCIDTAKKIDTDVGGAMMNGMSVRNDATILPMAQVTVVATIDAVSS